MKPNEHIVGEACRIEFDKTTGKMYLVFEIRDERYKNEIKKNWTHNGVEFRIIDKFLVKTDD
jgi:hypothetical protein